VKGHIVELGGEVRAKGKGPGGRSWTVGMERPMDHAGKWNVVTDHIVLNNKAVTTSGNYRSRILIGEKSYGHVMDPETGYPVDNGIVSVTVIANTAMEADAWDNGFFVMGIERSLLLLERRTDIHAHFVYKDLHGVIRDTASRGFRDHME
jgi:thiamine biosynthesis lipoprotein